MSQKTQISTPMQSREADSIYAPTAGASTSSRTFVPGMKRRGEAAAAAPSEIKPHKPMTFRLQDRQIVGILYSRSAGTNGEIYPVYLGRNTIGNNPMCDIYLPEESVAEGHAVILARSIPSQSGDILTVGIIDYDSESGTTVDGKKAAYGKVELHGGETITIGRGYVFRYNQFGYDDNALSPNPIFRAVDRVDNTPAEESYGMFFAGRIDDSDLYPSSVGEADEKLFYGRTRKKKTDHGGAITI